MPSNRFAFVPMSLAAQILAAASACAQVPATEPGVQAAMFRGDPAHTGVHATRGPAHYGGLLWRFQTGGPVRSTPAVAGGTVYVGSSDGRLYALERATGSERWHFDAATAVTGSPAVVGDRVFVTDHRSTLYALDAASGALRWKIEAGPDLPFPWGYESGDVYASSPVPAGGTVYWGAGDGVLRAADAASGEMRWSFRTEGRIRSTPAVADSRVVVGSADGRVYAVGAADGASLWIFDTLGRTLDSGSFGFDRRTVQSSPAIAEGRVYVGARDGFLYALDAATGTRLWAFDHRISWVNSSAAVADGVVYAGTSDGQFVQAVDAVSGEERWRATTRGVVWTSPALAGGLLYIAEGAGRVRALDPATGAEVWAAWVGDRIHGSAVPDDGALIVGAHDGGVYALGEGAGPLVRAVFRDSTLAAAAWFQEHGPLAARLEVAGYQLLDAAALERFLSARIDDRRPSVVVFAMDVVPDAVAAGGAVSPLRRYLESGGSIVWVGVPPLWPRDPVTGEPGGLDRVVRVRATLLTGADHDLANFDPMGVRPTPAGEKLGLPARWLGQWGIAADQNGIEVLATDELGLASAWRRSFGGSPGTGFTRVWSSLFAAPPFSAVLSAAELRPPAR